MKRTRFDAMIRRARCTYEQSKGVGWTITVDAPRGWHFADGPHAFCAHADSLPEARLEVRRRLIEGPLERCNREDPTCADNLDEVTLPFSTFEATGARIPDAGDEVLAPVGDAWEPKVVLFVSNQTREVILG